jgi:RNA polymerase sigma factor (TIGR02999 family)
MASPDPPITAMLIRWRGGDQDALNSLTGLVYDSLRKIAARHLARERSGFTLCATEVVHEAYQRLAGAEISWQDRAHFLAVASRQMRQLLVDHARTRGREQRGGDAWRRVTLAEVGQSAAAEPVDILIVQEALERLASFDPRKADLVDLMVFGGLTGKDVAEVMNISEQTVWREWRMAKAWLHTELKSMSPPS